MFTITIPGRSIKSALSNLKGRVLISQTYGNYASFYVFPKHIEHIGFRSVTKQIKKIGLEPKERASRTLMKFMAPEAVKNGTAGHMVSTFFAEAWANWGLIGIILSPIFVGLSLKFLVNLLIWLPKSELSIGFLSFLTYTFGINKSFSKILFPRYLIAAFIILFSFKIIEKKFYLKKKNHH